MAYWVTGAADLVYRQYESEEDPSTALSQTIDHLKKEFGRKRHTAREMLDELLKGPPLKESDTAQIQTFVLRLEQVYKRAVDTKREATFSTHETFNEILRRKLPHITGSWAKKQTDSDDKYAETEDAQFDLTFPLFIEHCRRHNKINNNKRIISKVESTTSSNGTGGAGKGGKNGARVEAKVAATTTSKPHKKSAPPQKGQSGANPSQTYLSAAKKGKSSPTPLMATNFGNTPKQSSAQKAKSPPASNHGEKTTCVACGLGKHALEKCREFLKTDEDSKRTLVRKQGLCFLCLIHGHIATDCPNEVTCSNCQGRHNTVFHREREERGPPDQNQA